MSRHMPISCIVSEIFPLPYRTAVTSYVILYIAYRMLSRFWRCRSYKVKWNGLNLLKIIRNVAIWLIAYDFLLEFRALSLPCIVCLFSRYSERGVENHVFLPRVYITPLSSNPAEFRQYLWREKSTINDVLPLHTIAKPIGHADRRTNEHDIFTPCIARSKNYFKIINEITNMLVPFVSRSPNQEVPPSKSHRLLRQHFSSYDLELWLATFIFERDLDDVRTACKISRSEII